MQHSEDGSISEDAELAIKPIRERISLYTL
jgi:hypothetical protein